MKFFAPDINKPKIEYKIRDFYTSMPIAELDEIRKMYEESLFESYWELWRSNPYTFAKDIQRRADEPKSAIRLYAKEIAALTIREWEKFNLTSVIAYQGEGFYRKIVGFSLSGHDAEVKVKRGERAYYLYYLGTHPDVFRKGIGAQLMLRTLQHCQQEAKKDNKTFSIKLHTRAFNIPAINLYEKFGFKAVPGDVTHGHNERYICYASRFQPEQEISIRRSVRFAV